MQLTGELSKVSLPKLLQLVRNGELTGKITFLQAAKTATIYIENGNLTHAEADALSGREALFELFLWSSASFSFIECDLGQTPRTLPADEPMERIIREGLIYLDQKRFLDQLRISGQSVLKPANPMPVVSGGEVVRAVLQRFDGERTIAEALSGMPLTRREYVNAVATIIADGLAVVVEGSAKKEEAIQLPDWVVARLRQDNQDISQAIVDMVVWVDRVKCWMYQVDADFGRIIDQLQASPRTALIDDDFYREVKEEEAYQDDFSGPLFGEVSVSSDAPQDHLS